MAKNLTFAYLTSKKFKEKFIEQVKKDTWDKGLPMVYKDDKGNIVKAFKDGKIEIISRKRKLKCLK